MGTNYYATIRSDKACPHCGHDTEEVELHIGKSSGGWCFSLHVIPERGLNSLDDWEKLMRQPEVKLRDEYGNPQTADYVLATIRQRSWPHRNDKSSEWYSNNHAEPGPHGLARHWIDNRHCIGHGSGTWDLITGEFS